MNTDTSNYMSTAAAGRSLASLNRVRVGVSLVLTLGVAASITANVLHAQPTVVGRAIAAWPPLALLLTVELISRVPVHSRRLAVLRLSATAAIAGIAAWVSYWHMVEVARVHGESVDSAHLIPLSVDGLVVVASICLVEIGARLRALTVMPADAAAAAVADLAPVTPEEVAKQPTEQQSQSQSAVTAGDVAAQEVVQGDHKVAKDAEAPTGREQQQASPARSAVGDTTRAIARLRRRHPDWTTTQIAARLGVHPSTVRRHLHARAITSTNPRTARNTVTQTARTTTSRDARTARASDDTQAA